MNVKVHWHSRPSLLIEFKFTEMSKLYVGNLSYQTTDADLKDFFAQAGQVVSATIITDKMSGRSKGFGFVEMSSEEEAKKAIEMLNGKDLGGRNLKVDAAQPQRERAPRGNYRN